MAEFLLAGGQQQTWLIGNKLITITTSGSGTKSANSAVCEKCQAVYHTTETKEHKIRRRHRSAVIVSKKSNALKENLKRSSQDDMTLGARSSTDDMTLDLGISGQDVGVQTGSSLSDPSGVESEPLETLILGL